MTTQSENHIRIGTRGSKLALWQANFTANALQDLGASTEIVVIKTQGDRVQDLPFGKLEGKGFFTKEIEEALLREEVDLAVHSMKDLPTQNPEGLVITAVSERYDPADWLLIRTEKTEKSRRRRHYRYLLRTPESPNAPLSSRCGYPRASR